MPTNEERREVAARLRNGSETRYLDFFDLARVFGIEESYTDEGFINMSDKVWLTLADLIEPEPERTCRIEGTYSDEFAIYDHLTCGHVNLRHCPETTSYCSTCGARVKEEPDEG